jgi:ketosteroid isomerase-like protein
MKIISPLSVLFIFLSQLSSGQNRDKETLKQLNRDWLNAIVNRDTLSLSHILADDFMLINPGGAKRNKEDNLANLLLPHQQVVSVDIDSEMVRLLSGEVGLITAWTTNITNVDGVKKIFKICYQDVYMKRRNKWVAVSAHVSLLESH